MHHFDIVVDDIRPGGNDRIQRFGAALKIGNQNFHATIRNDLAQSLNCLRKDGRAAVGQIVARHRGHNDIPQPQRLRGLRQSLRFIILG